MQASDPRRLILDAARFGSVSFTCYAGPIWFLLVDKIAPTVMRLRARFGRISERVLSSRIQTLILWALLSALTWWMFEWYWTARPYFILIDWCWSLSNRLSLILGMSAPNYHRMRIGGMAAFVVWYQPMLLRIGWPRALVWICVSGAGWAIAARFGSLDSLVYSALCIVPICGVTGLVAYGRRTRVWAGFLGGAAGSIATLLGPPSWPWSKGWPYYPLLNWPLALTLILGTTYISRRDTSV